VAQKDKTEERSPGSPSISSVAIQIASSGVADWPPLSILSNSDFIPTRFR
jgi:hypothetical protein